MARAEVGGELGLSDGWRLVVACWSADLRVRMASRHRVVLGSVICLSWALPSARWRPLPACRPQPAVAAFGLGCGPAATPRARKPASSSNWCSSSGRRVAIPRPRPGRRPAAWSAPAPGQGRHRQQQPDTDLVPRWPGGRRDGQVAGDVGDEQAAQPQEADHVGAAGDHAEQGNQQLQAAGAVDRGRRWPARRAGEVPELPVASWVLLAGRQPSRAPARWLARVSGLRRGKSV